MTTRKVQKIPLLVALLLLSCIAFPQERPPQSKPEAIDSLETLRERLQTHLSQPRFSSAQWGIKVVSLKTGETVFELNPSKFVSPASTAKLYTAALALDRLGGDYRIRTSVYASVRPDAVGTIKGDLLVYGRGDPSMAARLNGGDYYKPLEPLINALVEAGVRRIEGDLIADESYFTGPPFGSGWQWNDLQWYYGAEVSALSLNDNSLDLFVRPAEKAGLPCRVTTGPATSFVTLMNRTKTVAAGGTTRVAVYRPVGGNIIYVSGTVAVGDRGYSGAIAVHEPAGLFANLLKDGLAQRGIVVKGRARVVDWKFREVTPLDQAKLIELASVESLQVKDIVREMLKPSSNLIAQLMLLQVGARASTVVEAKSPESTESVQTQPQQPDAFITTEAFGIRELNLFLSQAGINRGEVLLEEGAGLSRRDLVTPGSTVELLRYMSKHRWYEVYLKAMPVAGEDGTLQNRMRGTIAAGNARAKTGTLQFVNALAGYVTTAAGEELAFAIALNNYSPAAVASRSSTPAGSSRDEVDAIVVMLASLSGRVD